MSSPDNELWQQSWRDGRMAFHQAAVNPLLAHYWSSLGLPPGGTVFVPLCGRSLDLVWLAEQGHQVIGCELSPVAVRDFFGQLGLTPTQTALGPLTLWQHGAIRIYCGDFFCADARTSRYHRRRLRPRRTDCAAGKRALRLCRTPAPADAGKLPGFPADRRRPGRRRNRRPLS